ncbi:MAG TPA: glycosyltransferase [Candidatus Paceibacterota bacterium]|nr:glycosyltransferase [Candidatus Paceibacterota bacterium]
MATFTTAIVYIFLFLSLYFEVFLLITYFERQEEVDEAGGMRTLTSHPTVTIMVPVWNEEKTVSGTVNSLLALDYPKDKLSVLVVDDGSTDGTWEVLQSFTGNPQVKIAKKPNGGKYTALNYGLERSDSEFVGCLDADSFVDPQALNEIMPFFDDPKVMSVVPSIKVHNPTSVIQLIQKVEYAWGIFIRKVLSLIDALYVTPGPLSIFRRDVFKNLGPYRHAHNTEDLELALRMQANNYKIVNAHRAYVYTVAPKTLKKLYKQRLRWTYGFLKNIIEYKRLFFNRKHGYLGMLVLPMATLTIFSALYFTTATVIATAQSFAKRIVQIQTVGLHFHWSWDLQWFYINTEVISFIGLSLFIITTALILLSRKVADGKIGWGRDLVYFLVLYSFIAPLWLAKSVYNLAFSRSTKWR